MKHLKLKEKEEMVTKHIDFLDQLWRGSNDNDQVVVELISIHYLVIAAYGVIESEMKKTLRSYAKKHRFADGIINKISNCYSWDYEKIIETLAELNKKLENEVKTSLSTQQKNSMKSLKITRNNVAHGDSHQATFEETKKQFEHSVKALYIISDIIKNEAKHLDPKYATPQNNGNLGLFWFMVVLIFMLMLWISAKNRL